MQNPPTHATWSRVISSGATAFVILLLLSGNMRAGDWKLVWSDEFDYRGRPNPSKWQYEVGMVRNNEPQCYTRSLKNAHVENGCLILEAVKGKVLDSQIFNPFRRNKNLEDRMIQDYSSASLCTLGKASWLYGKFEIRAKLPSQAGTWPAFWMLGVNRARVGWPLCGEIDIMERMWQRNGDPMSGIMTVLHFKKLLGVKKDHSISAPTYFHVTPLQGATTGFHIYTMEWHPDRIDFRIDGILCSSMDLLPLDGLTADNPFRKPMYLLLNLALNRRNKGFRDASFPARFEIDYVRVYQKKGAGV